jgi:hypothetical protein
MDIGTLRTRQGGKLQSWEAVVAEVRSTRPGPASIRELCEEAVAKPVQAAWANTGVGDVGTDCVRPSGSRAHTLLVHTHRWSHGLSFLNNRRARSPR